MGSRAALHPGEVEENLSYFQEEIPSALRADPHLGDLQKAAGSFPTPQGVVRVSHSRDSKGSIQTEIDAPKGIEIVRA